MGIKLDILAIVAHPDDAELSCGGTILKHTKQGDKVGIVDLTRGELGSRGTIKTRADESELASKILGLRVRENLGFRDGFFQNDEAHQMEVIKRIRKYSPRIILTNALEDRHPDHKRASQLVETASFLSGLAKIKTVLNYEEQIAHRPEKVLHFLQFYYKNPQIIVDISEVWQEKLKAIFAYKTQFYNPNDQNEEEETFISQPHFLEHLKGRFAKFGIAINRKYGEGFICNGYIGVEGLHHIF